MHSMIKLIALLVIFFLPTIVCAQEKRALLIGINQYAPPKTYKSPMPSFRSGFKNLSGPVNDVRSFHSVLLSRFNFSGKNIDTLINEAATRTAILKQLDNLLAKCKKGDIAFIMYAGHGSRVINTLSSEPDKKDESIVPADTYIPGVEDIRDKELAKIFNQFLDKGIKLTVFFDCCHSGSLSRGPFDGTVSRFIPDAGYDAKDASEPTPPETRTDGSFLIISASQNDEPAKEKLFDNKITYGGFSHSFLKALEQQSVNASVLSLFTAARAILKSNSLIQEPVIAGSDERLQQTFLGLEKGQLSDKVLIPVIEKEAKLIILQGGFATGLQPKSQLAKLNGNDTIAVYEIAKVLGVNKASAILLRGDAKKINPGDLLQVTNWVYSQSPLLKIFIPNNSLPFDQIQKLAAISYGIRQEGSVKWINDLSKYNPHTSIFFEGNKIKVNNNGTEESVPTSISKENILKIAKADSTFYFEMPAVPALSDAIRIKFTENKSIQLVNNIAEAQYVLYGTVDDKGQLAYGLRKAQPAAKDSMETMPIQTTAFTLTSADKKEIVFVVDSLFDRAMKLSKIRGWLNLTPPTEGLAKFPYHIEMVNRATGGMYKTPEVTVGDKVDFYLVFDSLFDINSMARKFVYVFVIDINGQMQLAYPRGVDGNQINQFPKKDEKGNIVSRERIFGGTIREPAGTDNYFILATDEAIPNHVAIFSQAGVRAVTQGSGPLVNLLNMGNVGGTRSLNTTVSNWTIIKMQVKSKR